MGMKKAVLMAEEMVEKKDLKAVNQVAKKAAHLVVLKVASKAASKADQKDYLEMHSVVYWDLQQVAKLVVLQVVLQVVEKVASKAAQKAELMGLQAEKSDIVLL